MKGLLLIFLSLLTLACHPQVADTTSFQLTISPSIDKEKSPNREIILSLSQFLQTKNNSLTENQYWLKSDFEKFVYPFYDIFNIERSKHGDYFYRPSLMEIIDTEKKGKKVVKIAYIGHNPDNKENYLRAIHNLVASVENGKIIFSKFTDYATAHWSSFSKGSVTYKISPNKTLDHHEVEKQQKDIEWLCKLLNTDPIPITYYSCINPIELFQIKGFDYNPLMYVDKSGGLAEPGNFIFSGINAECYTHEIVHIYTGNLFPNIDKLFDEGLATLIGGSGNYSYSWHRGRFKTYLDANPAFDVSQHINPYERLDIDSETSIPYLIGALICERTVRIFGKEELFKLFKSEDDFWTTANKVGLTKKNINTELRKTLKLPLTAAWQKQGQ